jgi:anti-sigma B factor antagonist
VSSLRLFRVTIEPLEDACVLRASGELDVSTAHLLSAPLEAARADRVTALLDMSAVSFIDSTGLRVLLDAARAFDALNWAWFIVGASEPVLRLVEVSGTASLLPLVAPPDSSPERLQAGIGPFSRRVG